VLEEIPERNSRRERFSAHYVEVLAVDLPAIGIRQEMWIMVHAQHIRANFGDELFNQLRVRFVSDRVGRYAQLGYKIDNASLPGRAL